MMNQSKSSSILELKSLKPKNLLKKSHSTCPVKRIVIHRLRPIRHPVLVSKRRLRLKARWLLIGLRLRQSKVNLTSPKFFVCCDDGSIDNNYFLLLNPQNCLFKSYLHSIGSKQANTYRSADVNPQWSGYRPFTMSDSL